jgi:hypothetical protein
LTRYEKSEYSGFENGTPSPLLFLYVDFSEYTNIYIFIRDGNLVGGGEIFQRRINWSIETSK